MGAGFMEEGGLGVGHSEKEPGRPMEILEFREEVLILSSAVRGGDNDHLELERGVFHLTADRL